QRQVNDRFVARHVRLVSHRVPAGVRQQVERLAGVNAASRQEVATTTAVSAGMQSIPVRASRVSTSKPAPAGSFALQFQMLFLEMTREPLRSPRQRAN